MRRAFVNARVVDPASGLDAPGGVLVEDGAIVGVGPEVTMVAVGEAEIVDCVGHVLAPGLVDCRVFTGEPGAEHKETLASASQAAAAGGVTTIVTMPETDPVIDDASLVDFVMRRARDTAIVRVRPMAALTKGLEGRQMTEMGLLTEAGAVGFTDGNRAVTDAQVMRRAMTYARMLDAPIVHHTLDPTLARGGQMNESEYSTRLGLAGIPREAETMMVERDLRLCGLTGARYHAAQISCAQALAAVEAAKTRGLPVTCAVSAHHLRLNEVDIANYRTFFKVAPPLRAEEDREAMADGVARGAIDIICSSHDPQAPENKRLPFAEATFGAVGLETLLPVALGLHHDGLMSLSAVLRALTVNPADLLKLDAGRLAPGRPADLVVFDPGAPWVLRAEHLRSRSKNTPFDGRRFQGRTEMTVVGGEIVYRSEGDA